MINLCINLVALGMTVVISRLAVAFNIGGHIMMGPVCID